jgi:futalosine hydrolase
MIVVAVATDAERPALPATAASSATAGGFEVLVTGVGKVGAAVAAARRLAAGGVEAIVSFGVAGAYPGTLLDAGDVVVALATAVLDEGLETGTRFVPFARPGMTGPGAAWTPTDERLRDRLLSGGPRAYRVVAGRIATVSVCAGTARLAAEREALGASAEGMEGAAVAVAAAHAGVPFAEVRGISNRCGPREGAPFDLATAVAHAAEVLRGLR